MLRLHSVNVNTRESDISCLTKEELEELYSPLGVNVVSAAEVDSLSTSANLAEMSLLFLVLAVLCWLGENFLCLLIARRGAQ